MTQNYPRPVYSLEELVLAIQRKWKAGKELNEKLQSARIQMGRLLLELRERVERGEAGVEYADEWWKFFAEYVKKSRREAERLMEIASAENPEQAYEQEKTLARTGMQLTRIRQRETAVNAQENVLANVSQKNSSMTPTTYLIDATPSQDTIAALQPSPAIDRAKVESLFQLFTELTRAEQKFFINLQKAYWKEV